MKLNKKWFKITIRSAVAVCVTIAAFILLGSSIDYVDSLFVFTAIVISGSVVICVELVYVFLISICRTGRSDALNIDGTTVNEAYHFKKPALNSDMELQRTFDLFLLKNKFINICNSTAKKRAHIAMKKYYVVRYADLMSNLLIFSFYLIALTLIVLSSRDSFAFYSTRVSMRQFESHRYFNNQSREPINVELFFEYLEHDFLPTIHTATSHNESNGWLSDSHVKILGVARLRQQRVTKTPCKQHRIYPASCVPMLLETTEDRENHGVAWKNQSNKNWGEKYWRIVQPWCYQNTFESQTIPQFGKSVLYSGGGYICNLGRTLANSLLVVEFIKKQHWIDRQTKVVFIEFTTYGADSNIFNVVTLIAEQTAIGYFELSYNIQSVQLLTIVGNLSVTTIFLYMFYLVIDFVFVCRIMLSLLQTNAKEHFAKTWNIIDLIIIVQSVGMVTLFFLRNQYVRSLLVQLEQTRNNEFVSFVFAAFLDQLMIWWSGVLVCVSTIRIWKILNFIFIFRVFSTTLVNAAKELFASTLMTILFLTCFGMLFYQLNSYKSAPFFLMSKSFPSLVAILLGFIDDRLSSNDIFSGTNWIELLLFIVSLAVVVVYLMNMIITVSCTYFSVVRRDAKHIERDKYSFCDFMRDECSNMFQQASITSKRGRARNVHIASFKERVERLHNLKKRLNTTVKLTEEKFCKKFKSKI